MNTFTAVLRQDLLAIRWIFAAWITSCIVLDLLPDVYLPGASFRSLVDYIQAFAIMSWAVLTSLMFARLVLGHSPVDARNGWRTRPLVPSVVAVEKILVCALVFVGTAAVFAWVNHVTPPLRHLSYGLLAAVFVGSLVPTTRALLAAMGIVGALVVTLSAFFFNRAIPLLVYVVNDTGAIIAQYVYVVGIAGLIVRQYTRPHSVGHAVAGGGVLLVIGALSWVFPNPSRSIIIPILHRPDAQFRLESAQPLADEAFNGGAYFNDLDRQFAEHSSTLRTHRNWSVSLSISGLENRELWFVRNVNPIAANHPGIGHRSLNPPAFFPTQSLTSFLFLRNYTFVDANTTGFQHEFQWVRSDGKEEFPVEPTSQDFMVNLFRVNHMIIMAREPLTVGNFGPMNRQGEHALTIREIDFESRTFDGLVTGPYFKTGSTTPDPNNRATQLFLIQQLRYTTPAVIAYNRANQHAGLVVRLPGEEFHKDLRDSPRWNRYQLPDLGGDPRTWELVAFIGEANGQVLLRGTETANSANSPAVWP